MTDSLAQRIFAAHLELSLRLGRKITMAEFGQIIATQMSRGSPFSAAAVSRWERGQQMPTPDVIEAIAAVAGLDPGWISHGMKSAAPQRSGEFPKYSPGTKPPATRSIPSGDVSPIRPETGAARTMSSGEHEAPTGDVPEVPSEPIEDPSLEVE